MSAPEGEQELARAAGKAYAQALKEACVSCLDQAYWDFVDAQAEFDALGDEVRIGYLFHEGNRLLAERDPAEDWWL